MVIPVYSEEIVIGPEHLDEMNHVNNTWHIHWMQEVAVRHSALNGWDMARYVERGFAWFVRQHTINYLQQIFEGDTIIIDTWVADMKHVSSTRKYRIRRKSDGQILASAQTRWGLVDLKTGRPHRAPEDLLECFIQLSESLPEEFHEKSEWTFGV